MNRALNNLSRVFITIAHVDIFSHYNQSVISPLERDKKCLHPRRQIALSYTLSDDRAQFLLQSQEPFVNKGHLRLESASSKVEHILLYIQLYIITSWG